MCASPTTNDFYQSLPPVTEFGALADPDLYVPLPDDWVVGVADIVGSTEEIARGRYKAVNMVGAAVISAQLNAAGLQSLPYVFGGDGAGFAVWPGQRAAAEKALDSVRRWAWTEFGMELRVSMITVSDIRAAGQDVRVARYAPADGVDFAMISGGGLDWAEKQMKAGKIALPSHQDAGNLPELTGLSCRWSNMQARNGIILSLVALPRRGTADRAFAQVAKDIIAEVEGLSRDGHPVPDAGPGIAFPPPGIAVEAQTHHGALPVWLKKLSLLAENFFIWALFRSNMRLGRFHPASYRASVGPRADFRKFDDGLKMTLDVDRPTRDRIASLLERARLAGLIRYGLHEQDEALMTCFVPSATEDNHVHFVDGAAGGYTQAAACLA